MMYDEATVFQILRNVGVDPECGACAAIAFTGFGHPTDEHTCKDQRIVAEELRDRGRFFAEPKVGI